MTKSIFSLMKSRVLLSLSLFSLIIAVLVTSLFMGHLLPAHAATTSYCKTAILEYQRRLASIVHYDDGSTQTYPYMVNALQIRETFCYNGSAITEDNGVPTVQVRAFPGVLWRGGPKLDLLQSYKPGETQPHETYQNSEDGKNTPKGIRNVHVTAHFAGIDLLKLPWDMSEVKIAIPDWRPDLTLRLRGDGSFDYSPSSGTGYDLVIARATDCTDPAFNPTTCRPKGTTQSLKLSANMVPAAATTDDSQDWCTNTNDDDIMQGLEAYRFSLLDKSTPDTTGKYYVTYEANLLDYDTGTYSIPEGVAQQTCTSPVPSPTPDPTNVSGSWSGSMNYSTSITSTLVMDLTQTGSAVTGTATENVVGNPDPSVGTVSGTISGHAVALTWSFPASPTCTMHFNLTLSTDGKHLNGSSTGGCSGYSPWTITLNR